MRKRKERAKKETKARVSKDKGKRRKQRGGMSPTTDRKGKRHGRNLVSVQPVNKKRENKKEKER